MPQDIAYPIIFDGSTVTNLLLLVLIFLLLVGIGFMIALNRKSDQLLNKGFFSWKQQEKNV